MRIIEYRAKFLHSDKWVVGNLILDEHGQPYIIPQGVFEADGHHLVINSDNPYWVEEKTIGQYTGLKDIKGFKIFEGDICCFEDNVYDTVVWSDEYCRFDTNLLCDGLEKDWNIEIIGNIHLQPDLLSEA